MEVENRTVVIKGFINGHPLVSDFELKNSLLVLKVEDGSKDVITKNLCLSIDPYQLNRMKEYSPSQEAAGFANRQEPGQTDPSSPSPVMDVNYTRLDRSAAVEYVTTFGSGGAYLNVHLFNRWRCTRRVGVGVAAWSWNHSEELTQRLDKGAFSGCRVALT